MSVKTLPRGPLMVDVASETLTDEERHFLCAPSVGAVILFARNFSSRQQVNELVREIKSLRSPELLVAVDQEGGRVQRFGEGFVRLPPLNALGQFYHHQPEQALSLAWSAGRLMAAELRQLEIDISFAPVLDIANTQSKVIGDRGFDINPETIVALATPYINGMHSAGMRATGKHFPGHGNVVEDSHFETPVDQRNLAQIENLDLIPFRKLAHLLDGMMTAHIHFPAVDSQLPTFSIVWIKRILRQQLGFDGVVFSDDLIMAGAHNVGDIVTRARLALAAGCNMALICNDPNAARETAAQLGQTMSPQQGLCDQLMGQPCVADQQEIEHLAEAIDALNNQAA